MKEYIEVNNLYKNYTVYNKKSGLKREKKIIKAIDGIDLKVKKGEFLGYIGPNGAGKSTTIKVLTGIMTPDSGEVSINNFCPWKDRKKYVKNIGVVFGQKTQMWWDLPVIDSYNLIRSIFKVEKNKYNEHLVYLSEKLNLNEIINQPVRQLSLGQRMRAEIAACMIHDPEILFLDEPTIGLDIVSKSKVLEFLKEINQDGKTIFLTTHDLDDIELLCNEVMVLNHGKIIYKGDTKELKSITELPIIIKATLKNDFMHHEKHSVILNEIKGELNQESGEITIRIKNTEKPAEYARILFKEFDIEDFKVEEPNIEEIIKNVYTHELVK